jgi:crossover junction endodeoxyribonuclease RusA
MKIVLPFPPSELFPNKANGKHWSSTRKIKDTYRDQAFYLAREQQQRPHPHGAVTVNVSDLTSPLKLTFVQPDGRHRDADNMLAASKHALDGVAKALGMNDKDFRPITIDWTREKGAGALIVEI